MKKHITEPNRAIQDFEEKAHELVSIALALTERRIFAAQKAESPVGKAMAGAALTIQAGLDTFVKIGKLKDYSVTRRSHCCKRRVLAITGRSSFSALNGKFLYPVEKQGKISMKTAFITGASSGIGKEAAKLFATNGWNVIATMRDPENEKEVDVPHNILQVRCDVRNPESIHKAFALALETFDGVDVLINNAGVYNTKPLESMSEAEVDAILDTNIKGAIAYIQVALPHFSKKSSGAILNVSSLAGFAAFPFQTSYHARK